jgi:hypothetical protein
MGGTLRLGRRPQGGEVIADSRLRKSDSEAQGERTEAMASLRHEIMATNQ